MQVATELICVGPVGFLVISSFSSPINVLIDRNYSSLVSLKASFSPNLLQYNKDEAFSARYGWFSRRIAKDR